MKYCYKCGKQISDDTTICMHCGCAVVGNTSTFSIHKSLSHNTPQARNAIIGHNAGRLWLSCMLGGLIFGLFMMIALGPLGLISGPIFGILMGVSMEVVMFSLTKKWAPKRAEISATKTIIAEGGANLDGNGGWLFITDQSVEYYTHKMNFDHRTLIFSRDDIQSIHKEGSKLAVIANNVKYVFVVNYVDQWINMTQANKI